MSCCISTFTFLFLFGSIGSQLIGFLTSFMVVNRFAPGLHDGLFNRCGAINYFQTAINAAGSFWTSARDGRVKPFSACYWWNSSMFEKDEKSMQAIIILCYVSLGIVASIIIFFLISLIERFKTRSLNIFIGVLAMMNAFLLTGIILLYTFLYAKEAKMTPDTSSPLVFSWSYYVLYGAAAGNFLTAILFCCNQARSIMD